ncbi:Uncharacterized conserved protein, DUF2267 family [Pannonibacter indicus]|uniref:Uncharacterized conserved protein, DUF2267 family n=2 Tax=Pannonibacter indicus TaxID=466044 RepID=A0A0K6IAB4_9HYPH|nr:DUF2267 domain-containing protein [Pannonibacter indicus]CUB00257.1 Uncharacterized conserved protein, DUF2267 family [Pannonibacter indicus]
MPMPNEYQMASQQFECFLEDARNELDLTTRNQTYTAVQGVLLAFRARLDVGMGLSFANELPAVLRAMFVKDWDLTAPLLSFASLEEMAREVAALRQHHNFAPPTAIEDVARALWKHVDRMAFARMLSTLPEPASEFWAERPREG